MGQVKHTVINLYNNSTQTLQSGALTVLLFTGEGSKLEEWSYELWLRWLGKSPERLPTLNHILNILNKRKEEYENAVFH